MKHSDRNKKILIGSFLFLIISPGILYKFIPQEFRKNNENRTLAEKPTLSIDNYNEYPSLYENYYNDYLPFKNELTNLNSRIKYNIFNISSNDAVIKGKDDWLFYNSKYKNDGDTLADYQRTNYYSDEKLIEFKNSLNRKKKFLESLGIEFYVYIASNKEEIYPEYMPDYYVRLNEKSKTDLVVEYLTENTDVNIVYPKETLIANKDKYQLYYKADTHWNQYGAYLGFMELMKAMGKEVEELENLSTDKNLNNSEDLANMINMSLEFEEIKPIVEYKEDIEVELVQEKENILNRYESTNLNGKKLLAYRDSFFIDLGKFLGKEFEETVLVWGAPFDYSQIKKEKPDVVILEVVERNLDYLIEEKK